MNTAKNIIIDNQLLETAMLLGGKKTPKETVNLALEEFVKKHKIEKLIEMFHTLDFDSNYDYKVMRKRK